MLRKTVDFKVELVYINVTGRSKKLESGLEQSQTQM